MRGGHARTTRPAAKLGLALLVVGVLGTVAGFATFAAFSSTTVNTGNLFTAGTVTLTDNDAGGVLYDNLTNQKPGVDQDRCIKVTYSGSLASLVRLYGAASPAGINPEHINLRIDKGTQGGTVTFPDCTSGTGFVADGAGNPIYIGNVSDFLTNRTNFSNGVAANPGTGTNWVTNDTLVYRFRMSVADLPAAQGASSGTITFTWEAQNQ